MSLTVSHQFTGSNYFPQRPEVNLAFERDYKSFPDYGESYYCSNERDFSPMHKYTNPLRYGISAMVTRKPQMGISASNHRRTLSNVSTHSGSGSGNGSGGINRGFQFENDDFSTTMAYKFNQNQKLTHLPPAHHSPIQRPSSASSATTVSAIPSNRMRVYENVPYAYNDAVSNYFPPTTTAPTAIISATGPATSTTCSMIDYTDIDRPSSLPFDTNSCNNKLRSSLKKFTLSNARNTNNLSVNTNNGSLNQQLTKSITPTNPTPPDSLTSDDSSYLSAKDGSVSSQNRVRFSPETILEQHMMPMSTAMTSTIRRLSRTRHSIGDTHATPTTAS